MRDEDSSIASYFSSWMMRLMINLTMMMTMIMLMMMMMMMMMTMIMIIMLMMMMISGWCRGLPSKTSSLSCSPRLCHVSRHNHHHHSLFFSSTLLSFVAVTIIIITHFFFVIDIIIIITLVLCGRWVFGGMNDLQERSDFWKFDFGSQLS